MVKKTKDKRLWFGAWWPACPGCGRGAKCRRRPARSRSPPAPTDPPPPPPPPRPGRRPPPVGAAAPWNATRTTFCSQLVPVLLGYNFYRFKDKRNRVGMMLWILCFQALMRGEGSFFLLRCRSSATSSHPSVCPRPTWSMLCIAMISRRVLIFYLLVTSVYRWSSFQICLCISKREY